MKLVKSFLSLTGRFLFILFILAATFSYAMFQGGKVSWTIFYVLFPFISYSILLFFYPMWHFQVERSIKTPNVQNGGKLIVSLKVKRGISWFPLLYTVASEKWSEQELNILGGDKLKRIFLFGFRKQFEWEYEIEKTPRGEHIAEGVTIELCDFFGWIRKSRFIEAKNKVLVFPKITELQYDPIDTQYDQGQMASPLNIVKDTTMATGVRNYQSGDRVTWIHWKSFARTQSLMTKEFEDRRSQDLVLILDTRISSTFEEQLELAASILTEASNQHSSLSFVTTRPTAAFFPFIRSDDDLHRALVHLAKMKEVPEGEGEVLQDLGSSIRQQVGSVVLITGKLDGSLFDAVKRYAEGSKTITCFVVMNGNEISKKEITDDIRHAKSKGIMVYPIIREQFASVFKEVVRQ